MKITPQMIAAALRKQNEDRSAVKKDKFRVDGKYAKYSYGAWIDLFDLAEKLNEATTKAEFEM